MLTGYSTASRTHSRVITQRSTGRTSIAGHSSQLTLHNTARCHNTQLLQRN